MKYLLTNVDTKIGTASIRVSDIVNGDEIVKDRISIAPGSWDGNGAWIATDITKIPTEVRADVIALWTAGVITAYRTANPYKPPVPPTPTELAREARRTNAEARVLRTRLLAADDTAINQFVDANVTDIPSARKLFKQILKIIAADMRED